ncbi:MAG: hypothetical protein QGH33_13145 [Pirellulaceae bacterium]|nr:hypothetical protein [Pirellulaceae bacterium]
MLSSRVAGFGRIHFYQPGVVGGFEASDNLGILVGNIACLADVVGQVYQEPAVGLGQRRLVTGVFRVPNQLPCPLPDGPLWLAREAASRLPMELLMV